MSSNLEPKPIADYNSLMRRAESLSKSSHPDDISVLIKDMGTLGSIHRDRLMNVIKSRTSLSLDTQKDALGESRGSEKPDQRDLAIKIIQAVGSDNLLSSDSHLWLWESSGAWKPATDRRIKQLVQSGLQKLGEPVSSGRVSGIADVLQTETFKPEHSWNKEPGIINLLNGELHWNGSLWDLTSHVREHYLTTQIPHNYDPNAQCPRFEIFLKEIFKGDPDSEEKASVLLEMIGYTLVSNTKFEHFVLLIGNGANGKSVVLDIIRLLIGTENVCAVQPSEFSNKFQRAHLHLKLANLVTEIAEGSVIADAELKAIVSGELTTVERKYQAPFEFKPFATCWFGSNHMPHTRDFSEAVFRRVIIIPFNNTFRPGVNADPDLKEKLAQELPGILNMALKAYGMVLQRGKFTVPASCLTARQEWKMEADQVVCFLADDCILEERWSTTSADAYSAYLDWTREVGIYHRLGRKSFSNRLVQHGCTLDKGTAGTRMIRGLRLKKTITWDPGSGGSGT